MVQKHHFVPCTWIYSGAILMDGLQRELVFPIWHFGKKKQMQEAFDWLSYNT